MPDSDSRLDERTPASGSATPAATARRGGWPLWLRILLAVVVVSFVWSPFLAMLARLSRVNPSLQPTGGASSFTPPAPPAGPAGEATAPAAPAPTP